MTKDPYLKTWSSVDFGRVGQAESLSHWDRSRKLVQAHGTDTLLVPNLREGSKETCPLPHRQVTYPRWRLSLSQGQALYPRWRPCPGTGSVPTMEAVSDQAVPSCPIKWDYRDKAVNHSEIRARK